MEVTRGTEPAERDELLPVLLRRAPQCLADHSGIIVWANRDFSEKLGHEPTMLVGRAIDSVIGSSVNVSGHRLCRRGDGSTFEAVLTRSRINQNGATLILWTLGRPGRCLLHLPEDPLGRSGLHDLELELIRTLHELAR